MMEVSKDGKEKEAAKLKEKRKQERKAKKWEREQKKAENEQQRAKKERHNSTSKKHSCGGYVWTIDLFFWDTSVIFSCFIMFLYGTQCVDILFVLIWSS